MNKELSDPIFENISCEAAAHVLGSFRGGDSLRTVIVIGSVHGNETSGKRAIERVVPALKKISDKINGRVFLLAGNTRALSVGKRFIDSDLNRHFTIERIAAPDLKPSESEDNSEDRELRELLEIFEYIINTSREEVYALDLHSTSAEGAPFGTVGDTLRNRDFALKFPITFLLGIEEQLDGTILEYLNNRGVVTLGFEAGQHAAESSVENHEALISLALKNAGLLSENAGADFSSFQNTLERSTGTRKILEIRYRHAVAEDDMFEMLPGFENFQQVKRGQLLANDRNGAVVSPASGVIMMPLYQKQGEDGFFIAREIQPLWLGVSRLLRKLKVANLIHLLPGVSRDDRQLGTYIVNTQIARFFPLQIFHLLGFRKRRWRGDKLIVSKRNFDTVSPFAKKNRANK